MGKNNDLDFTGQVIYTGIDVHKADWKVCVLLEHTNFKRFSQTPKPEILSNYLKKNFPGATYKSAYEAGYCGFWIHDELVSHGIENIVMHAADVPTTASQA